MNDPKFNQETEMTENDKRIERIEALFKDLKVSDIINQVIISIVEQIRTGKLEKSYNERQPRPIKISDDITMRHSNFFRSGLEDFFKKVKKDIRERNSQTGECNILYTWLLESNDLGGIEEFMFNMIHDVGLIDEENWRVHLKNVEDIVVVPLEA